MGGSNPLALGAGHTRCSQQVSSANMASNYSRLLRHKLKAWPLFFPAWKHVSIGGSGTRPSLNSPDFSHLVHTGPFHPGLCFASSCLISRVHSFTISLRSTHFLFFVCESLLGKPHVNFRPAEPVNVSHRYLVGQGSRPETSIPHALPGQASQNHPMPQETQLDGFFPASPSV
jgi:hypothetical protein